MDKLELGYFFVIYSRPSPNISRPSAAVKPTARRLNVKAGERSGASQEALTLSGLAVGCEWTDGGYRMQNMVTLRSCNV